MTEFNQYLEKQTCILCGEELHKLDKIEDRVCDFCGQMKSVPVLCDNSHCICSDCLSMTAEEFVIDRCLKYKGINPIELAVEIMNSPVVRMHGAEHHFIVPAVLTACLHNYHKSTGDLKEKLYSLHRRAIAETPRACSYDIGTCGAALGTGVFISSYLNHNLVEEDEWSLANKIIAIALKKVADAGPPRCCKRDTYLSLQATIEFMKDQFAIELPLYEAKCTFSLRNRTCKHEECQFYNLSNSLV
jgi:hypothetical protein